MSPKSAGYRMPAEWEPHAATWLALPYLEEEWAGHLAEARAELLAFAEALVEEGAERVRLLVADPIAVEELRSRPWFRRVELLELPYGDCWVRDTSAIGLVGARDRASVRFAFDGWGGKFPMPGDAGLSERVAEHLGWPAFSFPFVLEGGAIEVDGRGTCLTTRDCLLAARGLGDEATVDRALAEAFGLERVIWLDGALKNDHTDGHIDTLARFVAPGEVVIMYAEGPDPNAETFQSLARQLELARDARGAPLRVHRIATPGVIEDEEGRLMPASYCNFYIANEAVLVPAYGCPADEAARAGIAALFPGRKTVSVPARHVLVGGGALHCASQPEPAERDAVGLRKERGRG